jgi:hypothetical protein
MKHEPAHEKKPFDPADYPALREFFSAYLHQDYMDEYGSATDAVKGFLQDASGDEILQVKEEWAAFRRATKTNNLQETQEALGGLGSAWQPENEEELKELDTTLRDAKT